MKVKVPAARREGLSCGSWNPRGDLSLLEVTAETEEEEGKMSQSPPCARQYPASAHHCPDPPSSQEAKETREWQEQSEGGAGDGPGSRAAAPRGLPLGSPIGIHLIIKHGHICSDHSFTMWIFYFSVHKGVFIHPKSKIMLVSLI